MFKKSLMAAAAVAAFAGVADANVREINMYGASAQYLFWNDAADDFLASLGCSNITQAQTSDRRNGITRGSNCSGAGGAGVILRYSSKASYDGIRSLKGQAPLAPEGCSSNFQRQMADETSITGSTVGRTKCVDVTIGASDVAGESFTQSSSGDRIGHQQSGVRIDAAFSGEDTSGLVAYQPLVVPFGFFANSSVTVNKCVNTTTGAVGDQCHTTLAPCATGSTCATLPLDNVTRQMATLIFSGQVENWRAFGAGFPDLPVVACMRHAGSGTAAALDYAVMQGNGWGHQLTAYENNPQFGGPGIWFNEGSTDLMRCVNTQTGAIGYADADQLAGTGATTFPNARALRYNGELANRTNIRNGIYDFWTTQWMYEDPSEPTYALTNPIVQRLVAFASDPARVPVAKAAFWATAGEMNVSKGSDMNYPGYSPAANPQRP